MAAETSKNKPEKKAEKKPDFIFEVINGRVKIEWKPKGVAKLSLAVTLIVLLLLVIMALLMPEPWLNILQSFLSMV